MALLTSVLSVKLLDGVTGPAKGISKALSGIKAASLGINNTPVTALAKMDRAIAANNASLLNMRMGLVDAAAGFVALKGVIGEPVRAAREFQSAMTDVKKVVNFGSPEEADALAKGLLDLSTKIPVAAKELAGIAAAAGQAGLAVEDLLPFAENVAYVATAFSIPTEEAAEALAKLKTALGLTVPEVMLLADHMNVLANNMATSESDVLDIVRRVGALGEVNSIAAKEIGALGAAMSASGVESDVAATGIRNMILALVQGTNATKSQKAALAALGMDTVQVAKRVQTEGIGVIVEILEAIQMQAPDTRAALLSMMFGQRAVDALGPLLGNLGTLYQALGLVADDAKNAGAALQEFEKKAKASAAAQKVFENRVKLLGIALGNALLPDIDRGIGLLGRFAVKLSEGIDLMPGLTRVVVWATAAVVGLRVATIGLRYGFLLAKGGALQLARGLIVFRGVALATAASLGTLKAAFAAGFGKLVLLNAVAPAVGALKTLGAVAAGIGGALTAITLPIWLTIAGVTALGLAIYKYWKPISGFAIGFFRGLGNALEPIAPLLLPVKLAFKGVGLLIGWVAGLLGDMIGGIGDLLRPVEDVNGAWESFGENLGTKFGAGIMRAISLLKRLLWPLNLAVEGIHLLGSAFGGFGGGEAPPTDAPSIDGARAKGGPVSAGKSYLVGEKRPEIFTPSRSGSILPDASAAAGTSGGMSVTANFSFTGVGDADPAEIERRVRRALREEMNFLFRGAYTDMAHSR